MAHACLFPFLSGLGFPSTYPIARIDLKFFIYQKDERNELMYYNT